MLNAEAILMSKTVTEKELSELFSKDPNKQTVPYISRYAAENRSFYERSILAAKEMILRTCDEIICQAEMADKKDEEDVARKQFVKNVLFGPAECYHDALYYVARSIIKAVCICEAISFKNEDNCFEKLINTVELKNIYFKDSLKGEANEICFELEFDLESSTPLKPYDEDPSKNFTALNFIRICGDVAITDIYGPVNQFKVDDKPVKIANRGDDVFIVKINGLPDERCYENDIFKKDELIETVNQKIKAFDAILYHISKREEAENGLHCLSCKNFAFTDNKCMPIGDPYKLPLEDKNLKEVEKTLQEKYRRCFYYCKKEMPNCTYVIDKDVSQFFISQKFAFLLSALHDIQMSFARNDYAVVCSIVPNEKA